jgi:hypothetical protein
MGLVSGAGRKWSPLVGELLDARNGRSEAIDRLKLPE